MYTRRHTLYLENVLLTNVWTANTWVHLFEKNISFFECSKLFPCFLGFFLPIVLSSLIQILHHTWWVKFLQYEHINLLALERAGFSWLSQKETEIRIRLWLRELFFFVGTGFVSVWFAPKTSSFLIFLFYVMNTLMGHIFS